MRFIGLLLLQFAAFPALAQENDVSEELFSRGVFLEDADSTTNYYKVAAPDAMSADLNFILPTTAGSSNQFLQTNGSGTLTWANALVSPMTNSGEMIIG